MWTQLILQFYPVLLKWGVAVIDRLFLYSVCILTHVLAQPTKAYRHLVSCKRHSYKFRRIFKKLCRGFVKVWDEITFPCMPWSTSELRVSLVPLNMFKPSSNYFYLPFQGGASYVNLFHVDFNILFCLFLAALWSPAGKGLTSFLCCV